MPAPRLTVFVPMLNEEAHIDRCLASIVASAPQGAETEILVVDGGSSDRSASLVVAWAAHDARIRLLDNPARLQAAAFNRALAVAEGRYFARIDAHAEMAGDYLTESLALLESTAAVNVGGPIEPVGEGTIGRAIAAAYRSRFGLGHGRHGDGGTVRSVDSVSFGVWRTEAVRAVGGMDPTMAVNEDYELNYRLRVAGGTILWSPRIRTRYAVRRTLTALGRQYLRYGFWKARTVWRHPASVRPRQVVAPLWVAGLVVGGATLAWLPWWVAAAPLWLYALAAIVASIPAAKGEPRASRLALPIVFATIHLAWGVGFLAGLIRWAGEHRFDPRSDQRASVTR